MFLGCVLYSVVVVVVVVVGCRLKEIVFFVPCVICIHLKSQMVAILICSYSIDDKCNYIIIISNLWLILFLLLPLLSVVIASMVVVVSIIIMHSFVCLIGCSSETATLLL